MANIADSYWRPNVWPRRAFDRASLLKHETCDDEGAVEVFINRSWDAVHASDLLCNPTSIWFLSDTAFYSMLPSLLWVVLDRYKAMSPVDEDAKIGPAGDFCDSLFTNIERRSPQIRAALTPAQFDSLKDFMEEFSSLRVPGVRYGAEVLTKLLWQQYPASSK